METTYEFLRWEDIIRRDFKRPAWWAILFSLRTLIFSIFSGAYPRILHAHWRFGFFLAYPFVVLTGLLLASAMAGGIAAEIVTIVTAAPMAAALLGIAAACVTFFALLTVTEPITYMTYIFQDAASTVQYANRQRPDWEERLEAFAGYVVEAARAGTADEILIVGHSSGSFLAVDVLTRALVRDPKLGTHGPRVTLLTMGGNLPIVGFQRRAGWFRDRIAQLAAEPSVDWVDYQSRRDIMNFFRFDAFAALGIDAKQIKMNLRVVPVQFREVVSPETFSRLIWHFFELHFQYLRANERPAAFDYFMIVAGPFSLRTRLAMPADVTAAVAGDKETARRVWDRLNVDSEGQKNSLATQAAQKS